MKQRFTAFVILFAFLLLVFAPGTVQAAPAAGPVIQEAAPSLPSLDDLLVTLKNMGGLALFFAALINAGKTATVNGNPLIDDSEAPAASLILNIAALVTLVILQLTGRSDFIPVIDQNAGVLATILTSFLTLAFQLFAARKGHESVLAGFPLIGKSFSGRVAGENMIASIELNGKG